MTGSSEQPVKYVCEYCKSDEVSIRSWHDWNTLTQQWERDCFADTHWCSSCGNETPHLEVPVTDLKTLAQITLHHEQQNKDTTNDTSSTDHTDPRQLTFGF